MLDWVSFLIPVSFALSNRGSEQGGAREDLEQSLVLRPGLTVVNCRLDGLTGCSTAMVERQGD